MRTDNLFARYYNSRSDFVDGTTEFHRMLSKHIPAGSNVLEIGSGPTPNWTTRHLATFSSVVGVDVTPEIKGNTALVESLVFDGEHLPFAAGRFDACVSDWVIEHVEKPNCHFAEVARVLKNGGVYCFRTPNLWHYCPLASRLLPFGVHVGIANKLRGFRNATHDPFPTYYRANTARRIRRLCDTVGLTPKNLRAFEKDPSYGIFHPALFYPMFLYERFVNSSELLEPFRATLIAVIQKSIQAVGSLHDRSSVS
jgi:SAM-dependent methyltransferase